MPGFHARKSPSGSKRFHNCPGCLPFIELMKRKGIPVSDGPLVAAAMGTAAHFLLEHCIDTERLPREFQGRYIAVEDSGTWMVPEGASLSMQRLQIFEVDADMVAGVQMCIDYVYDRLHEIGVNARSVQLEGKTNPLPERDDTEGTADVTIDGWPVVLEVVDYKNGRYYVDHEDNPQILSYLLGRAHDTGWSHDLYRITVIQPNSGGEVEPRWQEYSPAQLRIFEEQHREACRRVDRAEEALDVGGLTEEWGKAWLSAGEHCGLCPAQAVCPERKRYAVKQAQLDFLNKPVMVVDHVPLQQALKVARVAKSLREYIAACEEMVKRTLLSGHDVDGAALKDTRGKRAWRDDLSTEVIIASMIKAGYITEDDIPKLFEPPALITGPQAEKVVPAKKRKEFAAAYLRKKSGNPQLTFQGDKDEEE